MARTFTRKKPKTGLILCGVVLVIIAAYFTYRHTPRQEASRAVIAFYDAEQSGDYGSAWKLLHSEVKKKFTQADYIKERTALFISDFGAKSFSYKIDDIDHIGRWRMSASTPYLKDVYRVSVLQTFKGIFGETTIQKQVYVTEENGEWHILWKY